MLTKDMLTFLKMVVCGKGFWDHSEKIFKALKPFEDFLNRAIGCETNRPYIPSLLLSSSGRYRVPTALRLATVACGNC